MIPPRRPADGTPPAGIRFPAQISKAYRTLFRPCSILFSAVLPVLLFGCTRPSVPETLPRADPGSTAVLERRSMLRAATETTRIVSGSDLAWRRPVAPAPSPRLLHGSAVWLFIRPQTLLTRTRSTAAELALPEHLALFAKLGFSGLFVSPRERSGRNLRPERAASDPDTDIIGFEPDLPAGTEQEWQNLAAGAARHGMLFGSSAPPLFTGTGPDFTLALRAVGDWPGLYALVELPDGTALPAEAGRLAPHQAEALRTEGVLPAEPAFEQPVGWAVTAPEIGADGRTRRWAYLFHETPFRPILNPEDPSGAARRLLSAGIIRQVGLRRLFPIGLYLGPLQYLHAGEQRDIAAPPEPGLSVLRALTREIRRYGGAAILQDEVPPSWGPALMRTDCDLMTDWVTRPAAEYALLSGDAGPLRRALDRSLADGTDHRRLLRPASLDRPLDARLLSDLDPNTPLRSFAELAGPDWIRMLPHRDRRIQASLPALAAVRSGIDPDELSPANARTILPLHEAVLLFRAGLPGVLALSGQDLAGIVRFPDPLPVPAGCGPWPVFPAWSPTAEPPASTTGGLARGLAVYPPPTASETDSDAFWTGITRLTELRRQTGVALGTLSARPATAHPGSAAVLVRLPDGNLLLTAVNFSDKVVRETFSRPRNTLSRARDLLRQTDLVVAAEQFTLKLRPFECRMIRFNANLPPESSPSLP